LNPQEKLALQTEKKLESVEEYKFEPIKGYPMLQWKGKRPFYSTQYYPAQLKESHGADTKAWMNKLFWGDNLQVMSHLLKTYRGQVDLIYIDPPFDSKADYKKKIQLKGKDIENDVTAFEEKQYTDIWTNDEYLQFMYERLVLMRELLSDTGSIYLHCDYRKVHHLRCIMDEIFGPENSRNEIVWCCGRIGAAHRNLPRAHDYLLRYSKSGFYIWNHPLVPYSDNLIKSLKKDEKGYYYTRGRMGRKMAEWEIEQGSGLKTYIDLDRGKQADDVWNDVGSYSLGKEKADYPTQKPEALLERVIKASSNPGDLVFDCFLGSGTTAAVAMKLGRRFIGADINLGAIQTTTKRLLKIAKEINEAPQPPKGGAKQTSFLSTPLGDCDGLGIEEEED